MQLSKVGRALFTVVGFIVVVIAGLEGAIELILRYPQAMPALYRPAAQVSQLKNYYLGFDRSIIQFRHDCAVYDETLGYRLRPGACTVRNREHTIEYAVNRAGLRDSDDKLADPAIIVLGDSQAMGWGVPAAATVAGRLSALTGRRVLNAAISSYDTARELALLRELVRPRTQYVVIAYCDNDFNENWAFTLGGSLPPRDRPSFERIVSDHERTVPYYPFKHVWNVGGSVLRAPAPSSPAPVLQRPGFEAMTFLAILDSHRDLLRGRHLIVLEANGFNQNSPRLAAALRQAAGRSGLIDELSSMHVIDTSTFLTDDDYFLIDDHMRPSGHDKIARAVAGIVSGESRWRVEPATDRVAVKPDSAARGHVDAVERKGALTVIRGWAARQDTGEPPASVALLRDGIRLAEAEPALARDDVATALGKPAAHWSGYGLAVRTDRLSGAQGLQVVAIWRDGTVALLADHEKLRENLRVP